MPTIKLSAAYSSLRGRLEAHEQPKNIKSLFCCVTMSSKQHNNHHDKCEIKVSAFKDLDCHALSRARKDGKGVKLIAALIFLLFFSPAHASLKQVDFNESMGIRETGRYNLMLRDGKHSRKLLDFYRNSYDTNFQGKPSKTPRIPKIMHQIWIGPKPFPELYKRYSAGCRAVNHKGWQYKLWGNDDVDGIFTKHPKYRQLFDEYRSAKNYPAQKDILEYLILYEQGGIFLDADYECIQSFDEIAHRYDFFSALEAPGFWSKIPVMSNAMVGSKAGNALFIDTLDTAIEQYKSIYSRKNTFLFRAIRFIPDYLTHRNNPGVRVPSPRKVLMLPLGQNLSSHKEYQQNAIVFPATYFNPIMPEQRYTLLDTIKYKLGALQDVKKGELFQELKLETIASQDFKD